MSMMTNSKDKVSANVNKKEVNSLKTKEDYIVRSKKFLHEANAYSAVAFRCKEMLFGDCHNAVMTNIAFACELYLKHLLLINHINHDKEHNFFCLYKKMPKEIRRKIKKVHPCSNIKRNKFENSLRGIGNMYNIFRYRGERESISYNFVFLMELMIVLEKECNSESA